MPMSCSCCGYGQAAEQQFTPAKAAKELGHYRHKGAGQTTRLLRDGLAKAGLTDGAVLDIGAGICALTFELLDLGMTSAVAVDASAAYLSAATNEAARRNKTGSIEFVHADFLSVAEQLPKFSLVTLDRMICCYPFYEPLLEQALAHAERGFAFSYPRDRWYVRWMVAFENARREWRKSAFRTFVHPAGRMQEIIAGAGFERVERRGTLAWSADVFVKRS